MTRLHYAMVLLAPMVSFLAAQDPVNAKPADLRVQVALKNGSTIVGIAKDGSLIERPGRAGFEAAPAREDRQSGIRVWYYKNLDGFLFLPYKTVKDVSVLGKLGAEESRILREAANRAEKEAQKKAATKNGKPARDESLGTSDPSEEEVALLKEFPPEQGWTPERYGELQRNRIVDDVTPTGKDARFVENFAAWDRARKKLSGSGGKRDEGNPPDSGSEKSPPGGKPGDKPRSGLGETGG